jgi:Fusaric acid resistance protein-like
VARFDPGLVRLREAAVTMAATLASFVTALVLAHLAHLSTSIVILAVALTLSIGRTGQQADRRGARSLALAAVVLPLVSVAANEIGTRIFRQPDLGDALFVLAISATIWARRLGPAARRIAAFATFPLVAMLIVPAPIVSANGSAADARWWSALVAVIALGWATGARLAAEHSGILPAAPVPPSAQPPPAAAPARGGRRIAPSTKMALQMAAALGAAFAVGRTLFGAHWTWVVLTAFIVSSGNRGRGDVAYKAVLRLAGAAAGTLAATALSGVFPPGDPWSIVAIFAVLAVGLWLRSVNYAFWAGGMTAALALLYGYYGERGISLLGDRLAAIGVGAALAVAAAWLLLPVRTTDILRRDIGLALRALDDYLGGLTGDPAATPAREARFRRAVGSLEHAAMLLRLVPAPWRSRIDHLPAVVVLEKCAAELPSVSAALAALDPGSHWQDHLDRLRADIGELRQANAQRGLPDPLAWNRVADAIRELPRVLDSPAPPPAPRNRFWTSTQKVLAYANRVHATSYELVAELPDHGTSLAYLVEDSSGGQAHLTWSRDTAQPELPRPPVAERALAEIAAGRTPSGYPYQIREAPDRDPTRPEAQPAE